MTASSNCPEVMDLFLQDREEIGKHSLLLLDQGTNHIKGESRFSPRQHYQHVGTRPEAVISMSFVTTSTGSFKMFL